MRKVIVIQGPNLNLLGEREQHHYGKATLEQIHSALREEGKELDFEVHISNIHSREEFRKTSLVSDGASGIIAGFGPYGYTLALMRSPQIHPELLIAGGRNS